MSKIRGIGSNKRGVIPLRSPRFPLGDNLQGITPGTLSLPQLRLRVRLGGDAGNSGSGSGGLRRNKIKKRGRSRIGIGREEGTMKSSGERIGVFRKEIGDPRILIGKRSDGERIEEGREIIGGSHC